MLSYINRLKFIPERHDVPLNMPPPGLECVIPKYKIFIQLRHIHLLKSRRQSQRDLTTCPGSPHTFVLLK